MALETTWLLAAFAVPLIVLSEHQFLEFTGLPKAVALRTLATIAGILLALKMLKDLFASDRRRPLRLTLFRLRAAIRWTPRTVLFGAALAVVGITALSTALSVAPGVSLWGREAGRDSFSLYNSLSYVVLFSAVAHGIRTRPQVVRLWVAASVSALLAALVGVAQHFGLAPLGIGNTMQSRITGPSGNPIFLGAVLTLCIPLVIAGGIALTQGGAAQGVRRLVWAVVLAATYPVFLATAWAVARGTWVGMLVALLTLIAALWRSSGRAIALRTLAVVVVAGAAAGLTIMRPSLPVSEWLTSQSGEVPAQSVGETSDGAGRSVAPDPNSIFSSHIAGTEGAYSAASRIELARMSLKLAIDRPDIPEAQNKPWAVRFLFGYGPDTFQYPFQLVAPAKHLDRLTSAAHNDPLDRLVEIGVLGVLAYFALLATAVWVLWRTMRDAWHKSGGAMLFLCCAALAALAGRFAEQMFGIPQAGDSMLFWLLLGLIAALPVVASKNALDATHRGEARAHTREPRRQATLLRPVLRGTMVVLCAAVVAGAGYLAWSKNISYLVADAHARSAAVVARDNPAEAVRELDAAISLASDVAKYHVYRAELLRSLAKTAPGASQALPLLTAAYGSDLDALAINPLWRDASFSAAYGAWELAKAGDTERALDAIAHYERLAAIMPEHPLVKPRLEQLYKAVKVSPAE